jgi:hypothetical protein
MKLVGVVDVEGVKVEEVEEVEEVGLVCVELFSDYSWVYYYSTAQDEGRSRAGDGGD